MPILSPKVRARTGLVLPVPGDPGDVRFSE
jgi:hypothetical protein